VKKMSIALGLLGAFVLLAGLTGCSTAESVPADATTSAVDWMPVTHSGYGQASISTPIPIGAKSVDVSLTCTKGVFELDLDDSTNNARDGYCGRTRVFHLPLSGATLALALTVPSTTEYSIVTRFLKTQALPDAMITGECEQLSTADTIVADAEASYKAGELTRAEWTAAMKQAAADFKAMSATAAGVLVPVTTRLAAGVATIADSPGSPPNQTAYVNAAQLAGQTCANNGTPITIAASYGG
jgi:hypothetical protein